MNDATNHGCLHCHGHTPTDRAFCSDACELAYNPRLRERAEDEERARDYARMAALNASRALHDAATAEEIQPARACRLLQRLAREGHLDEVVAAVKAAESVVQRKGRAA